MSAYNCAVVNWPASYNSSSWVSVNLSGQHAVCWVCSGHRLSCEPQCWLLWYTDPVQCPSEQLAIHGTGFTVLTASACSVTAHYTPIRWSERSNICFLGPEGWLTICRNNSGKEKSETWSAFITNNMFESTGLVIRLLAWYAVCLSILELFPGRIRQGNGYALKGCQVHHKANTKTANA